MTYIKDGGSVVFNLIKLKDGVKAKFETKKKLAVFFCMGNSNVQSYISINIMKMTNIYTYTHLTLVSCNEKNYIHA